jgi:NADH-quinone oxidoreductase subunit G
MCLVEVEKSPKLVPACHAKVMEGMSVLTASEKVLGARRSVMEFLFINHPVDCPVCDQAGECKLQDYFMAWQKRQSRYEESKISKKKAVPIGPHIFYDAERCILCTRCVRFMKEITGDQQLCVVERGNHSFISTPPGRSLDHQYSMNTVDLCPVGALTSRDFRFRKRSWFLSGAKSVCAGCARGCPVTVQHHEGRIYRLVPRENPAVNDCWLCDDGRLSYHDLNDSRLDSCLAKGSVTGAAEAAGAAASLFGRFAGRATLQVSPVLTCEEIWSALAFGRDVLKVKKFTVTGRPPWTGDDMLRHPDANPNRRGMAEIAAALGLEALEFGAPAEKGGLLVCFGSDFPGINDPAGYDAVVSFLTAGNGFAEKCDLAFPLAAHAEQDGTFVNADGLVQAMKSAGIRTGDAAPAWEWIAGIGHEPAASSSGDVFARMARGIPFFDGMDAAAIGPEGVWGKGVVPPERRRLCRRS